MTIYTRTKIGSQIVKVSIEYGEQTTTYDAYSYLTATYGPILVKWKGLHQRHNANPDEVFALTISNIKNLISFNDFWEYPLTNSVKNIDSVNFTYKGSEYKLRKEKDGCICTRTTSKGYKRTSRYYDFNRMVCLIKKNKKIIEIHEYTFSNKISFNPTNYLRRFYACSIYHLKDYLSQNNIRLPFSPNWKHLVDPIKWDDFCRLFDDKHKNDDECNLELLTLQMVQSD